MNSELTKGKSIIFSAPSGAGKTTIVRYLLQQFPILEFSISACSREPRVGEVDGKDYYFLGYESFKQKIDENAFLEWEEVYAKNYYGTLNSEINRIWKNGKIVVFDVDVVGGLNLKNKLGNECLSVFIQPPNIKELENRLRNRNTETEEKIKMRVDKAEEEMKSANQFDYIIENIELEDAKQKALNLITSFITK
jgi:guanylate kinase